VQLIRCDQALLQKITDERLIQLFIIGFRAHAIHYRVGRKTNPIMAGSLEVFNVKPPITIGPDGFDPAGNNGKLAGS
jgi:hypothetical protein